MLLTGFIHSLTANDMIELELHNTVRNNFREVSLNVPDVCVWQFYENADPRQQFPCTRVPRCILPPSCCNAIYRNPMKMFAFTC